MCNFLGCAYHFNLCPCVAGEKLLAKEEPAALEADVEVGGVRMESPWRMSIELEPSRAPHQSCPVSNAYYI